MKSRIKIDYERGIRNNPVIKIITPIPDETIRRLESPLSNEDIEEDVQDRLVKDLLHSPCKCDPNYFFEIKSSFPLDIGSKVTTIGAIQEEDILYTFRHAILNRYVPYNDVVEINREFGFMSRATDGLDTAQSKNQYFELFKKIHQFFDWLDVTEQAAWVERHPYIGDGKQVTLKEVGVGHWFTFGGVKFLVDKVSQHDPEMLFCQIDGKEAYVYMTDSTVVEIEN